MKLARNSAVDPPRKMSIRLCVLLAVALCLVQVAGVVVLSRQYEKEQIAQAGESLAKIAAQLPDDASSDHLLAQVEALRAEGISSIRARPGEAGLALRNRWLFYNDGRYEVALRAAELRAASREFRAQLSVLALLTLLVACGVAIAFLNRNQSIRAAERVDQYARELESQNRELLEAKQTAELADRAKTEFLANISHELRTPLTAILGFAENWLERAEQSGLNEDVEDARTIQRNSAYLSRILSGLLDFSNLEAGRLILSRSRCSPREILNDIEFTSRLGAEQKHLRLRSEIDDDVPDQITTDPARVHQVLTNLVENAIKFTSEGSVTLRASVTPRGYGAPRVAFDVIDTGVGMSEETLKTAFESFSQADSSSSREYGGLGLGLALATRLVELLGGELTVVSTLAEGSAFRLTLPLEGESTGATGQISVRAEEGERLRGRILVAEDGPDNRKLLERILGKMGVEMEMVDNGADAVELALAADRQGDPFGLILMDMQMPRMDGITATTELRRNDYTGPIVALTADARSSHRDECLRAGCNEYLEKPIERPKLYQALRELLN